MRAAGFYLLHPAAALVYFIFVLAFSMTLMHPVCLAVSLLWAVLWAVKLTGKRALGFFLKFVLPMMLLAAALNPAFNHRGATILAYFPGGNPLTLESLVYGGAAALMLGAVIMWFRCLSVIMDSDKLVYLFGKAAPALSLVFSMTLRFAGRFAAQFRAVNSSQRALYGGAEREKLISRLRRGIRVFSITLTWSLENAVETADAMKSRGYGLSKRTAFSLYRMTARDTAVIAGTLILGGLIAASAFGGGLSFCYFPDISGEISGAETLPALLAYFCLCAAPAALDVWEDRRWKRSELKI